MKKNKIPKNALALSDLNSGKITFFAEDGKPPRLDMVALSGKPIPHYYWGNLGIDLEGMKLSKSKYPVLMNHSTNDRIGFTGKPIVEDNQLKIDPDKTVFLNNENAQNFIDDASKGFPFEASIYGIPTRIEELKEGTSVVVNGHKLSGPGTVWREWEFKETSVCVFGKDSNTKSSVFSDDATEEVNYELLSQDSNSNENPTSQEDTEMEIKTVEQLSETYPDLVQTVKDGVKTELETKFNQDRTALDTRFGEVAAENTQLRQSMLKLEKKEALRAEAELEASSNAIWDSKLSESNVAERLFGKIKKHVDYSDYVKDEVFDKEAFSAAIDSEITDWEGKGVTRKVMGSSFTSREEIDSEAADKVKLSDENKNIADSMLAAIGHKVEK